MGQPCVSSPPSLASSGFEDAAEGMQKGCMSGIRRFYGELGCPSQPSAADSQLRPQREASTGTYQPNRNPDWAGIIVQLARFYHKDTLANSSTKLVLLQASLMSWQKACEMRMSEFAGG